jgi:hypothetical protein
MDPKCKGMVVNDKEKESFTKEKTGRRRKQGASRR